MTFSGRVLNALTGKPLAGVEVWVGSLSPELISSGRTGAGGTFKVTALSPSIGHLRLTQYGSGAFNGRERSEYWHRRVDTEVSKDEKIVGPKWIKNLEFRLMPLASIKGHLRDEATGQRPLTPEDVNAIFETKTQNGWRMMSHTPTVYSRKGEFSFTVPVGAVKIASGMRKGYSHAYSAAPQRFDVPAKGLQNQALKVRRNPGFLVRLHSRDKGFNLPYGRYAVHWRRADGKQESEEMQRDGNGYYWFGPAKAWGEALELRILRDNAEVTAWRRVVADKKQWPLFLNLPSKR